MRPTENEDSCPFDMLIYHDKEVEGDELYNEMCQLEIRNQCYFIYANLEKFRIIWMTREDEYQPEIEEIANEARSELLNNISKWTFGRGNDAEDGELESIYLETDEEEDGI